MKKILLLGAGLSASSLIRYLLTKSEQYNWQLRVVDQDIKLVEQKLNGHPNGVALTFNALDPAERRKEIKNADLVISMLPARFHPEVARDCVELKVNLVTPSYISPEMRALDQQAKESGIILMNEIGVDPGIDHLSAMRVIDRIHDAGGIITTFKSYCGGLIAPEDDTNPWNYKLTWNPRNVVLAAQGGTAKYIEQGEYKYIPVGQVFKRTERMQINGYGEFEGYANRDSLSYRTIYGLEHIPTIFRGTLRRPGYSEAWNVLVELGMTDDSYCMEHAEQLSPRKFLNAFLPYDPELSVEAKFKRFLGKERAVLYPKFEWLGLFEDQEAIGFEQATPAQILEKIVREKWKLEPGDKDMLVMVHVFEYELNGQTERLQSSLVCIGEDETYTAMANTVGLPLGIVSKMILNDEIKLEGVQLPVMKEVYDPVLNELEEYGIVFHE